MGFRPLEICLILQCGDQLYPRAVRINKGLIFIFMVKILSDKNILTKKV